MDTTLREAVARLDAAIAAAETKLDELRRMRSTAELLWQFIAGDALTVSDHVTTVLTPGPVTDAVGTRTTETVGASAAVESVMDKSGTVQSVDDIWEATQRVGHDEFDRAQVRGGLYYLKRVGRIELVRRGHWRWLTTETSESPVSAGLSEPMQLLAGQEVIPHADPEEDRDHDSDRERDDHDRVGASIVEF